MHIGIIGSARTSILLTSSIARSFPNHAQVCHTVVRPFDACYLFQTFSPLEKQKLYDNITTLILSTDLSKHFGIIQDFERIVDNFQWDNEAHRLLLLIMYVISHI